MRHLRRFIVWIRRQFRSAPSEAELWLASCLQFHLEETKRIPIRVLQRYADRLREVGIHADRLNEKMPAEVFDRVLALMRRRRQAMGAAK